MTVDTTEEKKKEQNSDKQSNKKKEEHSGKQSNTKQDKKQKKQRIRKFPIWLRLITVFVLIVISLVVGLIVGYSVFGDGNAIEVFQKSTWQHIFDIVNKEK